MFGSVAVTIMASRKPLNDARYEFVKFHSLIYYALKLIQHPNKRRSTRLKAQSEICVPRKIGLQTPR
jgi:hypothetical protein